jgi:hypothetical protein
MSNWHDFYLNFILYFLDWKEVLFLTARNGDGSWQSFNNMLHLKGREGRGEEEGGGGGRRRGRGRETVGWREAKKI